MSYVLGVVVVSGTAGQVLVLQLKDAATEDKVVVAKSEMVTEKEGFVWKGNKSVTVKWGNVSRCVGLQVTISLHVAYLYRLYGIECR